MSKKRTKASARERKRLRPERKTRAKKKQGKGKSSGRLKLAPAELKAILERARSSPLSQADYDTLTATVDTLAFLTQELEAKGASIRRLRRMLFGTSTEKTSKVVGTGKHSDDASRGGADPGSDKAVDEDATARTDGAGVEDKERAKGHGRNAAADYRGADKVELPHESLKHGDLCPSCREGKVYKQAKPAVMVRVHGMAPLNATVYERQRLRCNLCGEVFTARPPKGVGTSKYDETAASMIGLLKYGCGMPFNRLERLQQGLGIPLPAATQWDVVHKAEARISPAFAELIRQAAQGKVLYNDDTTVKILELMAQAAKQALPAELGILQQADSDAKQGSDSDTDEDAKERTGIFTSGIVATCDGHRITLFFSGRKHAGENLEDVLRMRAQELTPPIQMCDALSRNTTGEFETILANCNSHARRKFVEVAPSFPDECLHVLKVLRKVYENDAEARKQSMSPEQRLRFHQALSKPLMDELKLWFKQQFAEHLVEPNSGLGDAINYFTKHWGELTLFLRVAGAPLDNNICERALKKAILHRKNALFYKTVNGARVGDTFMSLIHTCETNDIDPFDYLTALQRHHAQVAKTPGDWMPWNYLATLTMLTDAESPAAAKRSQCSSGNSIT